MLRKGYAHILVLVNTHTILWRRRGEEGGEGDRVRERKWRRYSKVDGMGGGRGMEEVQEWDEVGNGKR